MKRGKASIEWQLHLPGRDGPVTALLTPSNAKLTVFLGNLELVLCLGEHRSGELVKEDRGLLTPDNAFLVGFVTDRWV